jgi:hypothetical protein
MGIKDLDPANPKKHAHASPELEPAGVRLCGTTFLGNEFTSSAIAKYAIVDFE